MQKGFRHFIVLILIVCASASLGQEGASTNPAPSMVTPGSGISSRADARISKVLPHYLDLEGRHTLWPSLYERDAYQALLRKTPEQRSGLRLDVHWKAKKHESGNLVLKAELRGLREKQVQNLVLTQQVEPTKLFQRWTPMVLGSDKYSELGDLIAWRVTLWDGEQQIAEQKSFLWR